MFVTPGYAQETAPAEGEAHTQGGTRPEGEAHPVGEAHPALEGHTEQGAEHGGGVFPPFDPSSFPSQILWLAITFGLFYLFLKKVVLPRIGGILEVRSDRIAQDLEQAARMKGEADAAVAAYEQELAEAKGNANAIGQKARDGARADADAERKRVEATLEEKLAAAEANIASIKAKAMNEVGTIAEDTAAEIVRSLVGGADKAAVAAAVKAARG
ncbi:F0F1 ATP synthase subunit B [Mesorhizobium sp. LHD-90]|uniref:F0F1 ATP synthase subunit B n=1 Tax=Mesorhizobium sp. LHD-90 TaxID=3071414 RepID=UPI0027E07AD3|nr:F0F1 ATP synthase subunit B [Mesorhizobium sp. LHD-90]MDQ6436042.1 F0F1 ATP synthase subunit B [Mesorhizobium sp. LHD-90]